ncbi:MAG: hypothetical protein AB1942_15620 [Pseudomonadota bacterium]
MYISPPYLPADPTAGCIPALLADTMVTFRRVEAPEKEADFTAATFRWEDTAHPPKRAFTRKLVIEGRCATALAGHSEPIAELLNTLHWELPEWEKSGRPMRAYGDRANLYRGRVEALGVWVAPDRRTINSMGAFAMMPMGPLGLVGAIGKGGASMLNVARQFARTLDGMAATSASERIRGFAAAINGKRLADELMGHIAEDTGGYVEFAAYDPANDTWTRGPRSLSFFIKLDRSCGAAEMIGRVVAYEPTGGGRMLTLDSGQGGLAVEFDLQQRSISSDVRRWFGWPPQVASVTFFHERDDGKPGAWTSTVSTRPDEIDSVTFTLDEQSFRFGLAEDFLDEKLLLLTEQVRSRLRP